MLPEGRERLAIALLGNVETTTSTSIRRFSTVRVPGGTGPWPRWRDEKRVDFFYNRKDVPRVILVSLPWAHGDVWKFVLELSLKKKLLGSTLSSFSFHFLILLS